MNKKMLLAWAGVVLCLLFALVCSSFAASMVFLLAGLLLLPLNSWQTLLKEKLELFGALKTGGVVILLILGVILTQTTKPAESLEKAPVAQPSVSDVLPAVTPPSQSMPEPEETPALASVPAPEPTSEPTPTPSASPTPTPEVTPTPEPEGTPTVEPMAADYVLNTNSKKIHIPSCSSVSKMKESNKQYFVGTRDEAIAQGYSPCGNCKP